MKIDSGTGSACETFLAVYTRELCVNEEVVELEGDVSIGGEVDNAG